MLQKVLPLIIHGNTRKDCGPCLPLAVPRGVEVRPVVPLSSGHSEAPLRISFYLPPHT